MIVIIPEGIETLYSAGSSTHAHKRRDISAAPLDVRWHARGEVLNVRKVDPMQRVEWKWKRDSLGTDEFKAMPGPVLPAGVTMSSTSAVTSTARSSQSPDRNSGLLSPGAKPDEVPPAKVAHEEHDEHSSPHAWVGLSLILGFILMYLIDQLPRHASSQSNTPQQPYHISLENLGRGLHRASSSPNRADEPDGFNEPSAPQQSRSLSTTTGLVIHAAADGIALGASSSTSNTSLSFIIFLAIMVHKAPAAFGLTSVLLKQGLTKRGARGHLIIFSLAAPIGALATWTIVNALGGGRDGSEENTKWWVGITLLFSGGTFL